MSGTPPGVRGTTYVTDARHFRGDRFDEAMRHHHGLTTEVERAKALGVTRMFLWRLRNGEKYLDLQRAQEIADLAHIPLDELFPKRPEEADESEVAPAGAA